MLLITRVVKRCRMQMKFVKNGPRMSSQKKRVLQNASMIWAMMKDTMSG